MNFYRIILLFILIFPIYLYSSAPALTKIADGGRPPNAFPVCGNAVVESPEQCDDGNCINGDGCSSTCQLEVPQTAPYCGDHIVNQSTEQCDDGNNINGDGCSSTCQIEMPLTH